MGLDEHVKWHSHRAVSSCTEAAICPHRRRHEQLHVEVGAVTTGRGEGVAAFLPSLLPREDDEVVRDAASVWWRRRSD